MRLTVHTDYSLRLLMYLALEDPLPATIVEVADHLHLSKNHLVKVVYRLRQGGYVQTLRGRSGGLRLPRPASEIRLGEVVQHTESDMALVPCYTSGEAVCVLVPECELRRALDVALAAFVQVLNRFTIADITRNRAALHALLAIAPGVAGSAGPELRAAATPKNLAAGRKRLAGT